MMCRWSVAKDRTIAEKILSYSLDYLPWFHAGPFVLDFEWRGNKTSNYWISDICQSAIECHLFVLFKGFLTWVREVAMAGEEGGGIGGKLPPSMMKKPWFQKKHWGTLTNWIWPIPLSKTSINLFTPQPHFLFFKTSPPV